MKQNILIRLTLMLLLIGMLGCSDVPYTGSGLRPSDVDKYITWSESSGYCLTHGGITKCLIDLRQGNRGLQIHIYPKSIAHTFYYDDKLILTATRPEDTSTIVGRLELIPDGTGGGTGGTDRTRDSTDGTGGGTGGGGVRPPSAGDPNGDDNGDTNGDDNGDTNGDDNGDTNGDDNGDGNGDTNGDGTPVDPNGDDDDVDVGPPLQGPTDPNGDVPPGVDTPTPPGDKPDTTPPGDKPDTTPPGDKPDTTPPGDKPNGDPTPTPTPTPDTTPPGGETPNGDKPDTTPTPPTPDTDDDDTTDTEPELGRDFKTHHNPNGWLIRLYYTASLPANAQPTLAGSGFTITVLDENGTDITRTITDTAFISGENGLAFEFFVPTTGNQITISVVGLVDGHVAKFIVANGDILDTDGTHTYQIDPL